MSAPLLQVRFPHPPMVVGITTRLVASGFVKGYWTALHVSVRPKTGRCAVAAIHFALTYTFAAVSVRSDPGSSTAIPALYDQRRTGMSLPLQRIEAPQDSVYLAKDPDYDVSLKYWVPVSAELEAPSAAIGGYVAII